MAFPRRPSRTPRSRFTLGLLLLTAVTLLALDLPGTGPLDPVRGALAAVFRPFRSAGDAIFEPISNGWKGAFSYDDVKEENDELKTKLDELESQDARIAQLEAELKEQKKVNGIEVADQEFVTAQVTGGPLNSFDQAVEIDVGKDDGVRKGMAVVTEGGVLGTIDVVRGGTATVRLITDSSSSIGVRLPDGTLGTVVGQGPDEPLRFEPYGTDDDARKVRDGSTLTTSGIDRSAFPGGLLVGTITEVDASSEIAAPTIDVEPAAELTLIYVKVIKKAPPR